MYTRGTLLNVKSACIRDVLSFPNGLHHLKKTELSFAKHLVFLRYILHHVKYGHWRLFISSEIRNHHHQQYDSMFSNVTLDFV